jgi:hypothetical protein
MKLTVKTSEVELEVEFPTMETSLGYNDGINNILKITTELIDKCSTQTIELIKTRNDERNN